MLCKTCLYSLSGLIGPPYRCPECGNAFDPDDPTTYDCGERPVVRYVSEFVAGFFFTLAIMLLLLLVSPPHFELFIMLAAATCGLVFVMVAIVRQRIKNDRPV